jgi:hypothetical protein
VTDPTFMSLVAAKIVVTPALMWVVSAAARRWGSLVGGLLRTVEPAHAQRTCRRVRKPFVVEQTRMTLIALSRNTVFIGASNELGEFESGTLAAFAGAVPAVVIGGRRVRKPFVVEQTRMTLIALSRTDFR